MHRWYADWLKSPIQSEGKYTRVPHELNHRKQRQPTLPPIPQYSTQLQSCGQVFSISNHSEMLQGNCFAAVLLTVISVYFNF